MESISMGDEPSYSTGELADDDDDEEQVVVAGGGRLYKCIFCKRGFTTAQALGGHMNIHRKDRAKGRRPLNINNNDHLMSNRISSKIEDHSSACYAGPRSYHQPVFASYTPSYTSYQEGFAGNYTTYFSSTSSTAVGARNQENSINNHQEDIVDHEVIRNPSSLRLQFGCSYDQNPKRTIDRSGNEEHELDLELRLGYDP